MPYSVHAVEKKWRDVWRSSHCFRAPDQPQGRKFFNFDSGPFCNGRLHIGHVRTYVLGDVIARYHRLLGKCVLYCTDWDAFGLPNELGAKEAGIDPLEYSTTNIRRMRESLERLGISYDWNRVQATCDPAYYRWTQWLFLELYRHGLAYRAIADTSWCATCECSLGRMQIENGRCWRCESVIENRIIPQWFVATSKFSNRLRTGVERLNHWSNTGKRLLQRVLPTSDANDTCTERDLDWLVSRQRAWGTPIPIVHCRKCGIVPAGELPVRLPDSINWTHGLAKLRQCRAFVNTHCPKCRGIATRETDTLDCFFDDAWSYLSCVTRLNEFADFPGKVAANWMPVDHFHSGFDTFNYLNLYRFIGAFLCDLKTQPYEEPLIRYVGHNVVTSAGRKMSKHLRNATAADDVMAEFGSDALRLAVLWAAAPGRSFDWHNVNLRRSVILCERLLSIFAKAATCVAAASVRQRDATSRAATKLAAYLRSSWPRIGKFIEDYRPNAAVEEIARDTHVIEDFIAPRAHSGRLSAADADSLQAVLREFAIVLSPFVPFLAEEGATFVKLRSLAATGIWPNMTYEVDQSAISPLD